MTGMSVIDLSPEGDGEVVDSEGIAPPAVTTVPPQGVINMDTGEVAPADGSGSYDDPAYGLPETRFPVISPIRELEEFDVPFEMDSRQPKTAVGLMTTFDPEREIEIIKKHYPETRFMQDEEGNILIDGTAYGGNLGYLNKPGISRRDVMDFGGQMAAFTPAARTAGMVGGVGSRMLAVGGASGATQAGIDLTNQAMGGAEDVSAANIDAVDVAIATFAGGAFEGLAPVFSRLIQKVLPFLKGRPSEVTSHVKSEFQRIAAEAGKDPAQITDEFVQSWINAAHDAVDSAAIPAIKATDEFGIRYTKGQATGSARQLEIEDSLREGAFGPDAQTTMETFAEQTQKPSISNAVEGTQSELSGGSRLASNPSEAGAVVKEGVQAEAEALESSISQAYDEVGEAFLSPQGLDGLLAAVQRRTRDIEFDKSLTSTASVLDEVKQLRTVLRKMEGSIRPFALKQIEGMRRRLGRKIAAAENPEDRRQVTLLKAEFDRYLDAAVDGALFSGDEGAIAALKEARGLRAEYSKKFGRNDKRTKSGRPIKDEAGDVIERMIAADPTDEQVVNYIFGANKVAGKRAGNSIAQRLKTSLGAESPEWKAIREAAFMRMTMDKSGVLSGRRMVTQIESSMHETPTLMKTLFSPEEIKKIERLAASVKRAQPDPRNPSRTAYKAAGLIRQMWEGAVQTMGFAIGGVGGAAAAKVGIEGSKQLSNRKGAATARDAIKGVLAPLKNLPTGNIGAPVGVMSVDQL